MKNLIIVFFVLISFSSYAQYDSTRVLQVISSNGNDYLRSLKIRGGLIIPTDTPKIAYKDSGAIAYKQGSTYIWTGRYWSAITGGSTTIPEAYANGSRFTTSATQNMAGNDYTIDSLGEFSLKQNGIKILTLQADGSIYQRNPANNKVILGSDYDGRFILRTDNGKIAFDKSANGRIAFVNPTTVNDRVIFTPNDGTEPDLFELDSTDLFLNLYPDSLTTNFSVLGRDRVTNKVGVINVASGSGTVSNIATGYGLSGGPITTTGTILADTSVSGLSGKYIRIADSATAYTTPTQLNLKANINSQTFTGTPTLPTGTIAVTQSANNNSTAIATTAYVDVADGTKWSLTGNSGITAVTNFIGTTDNKSLRFRTNNLERFRIDSSGTPSNILNLQYFFGLPALYPTTAAVNSSAYSLVFQPTNTTVNAPNGVIQLTANATGNGFIASTYSNWSKPMLLDAASAGSTPPATSAILDVASTTKGALLPRMTTTQKNAISSPAEGLEVYDLTLHQKSYYNGSTWINY